MATMILRLITPLLLLASLAGSTRGRANNGFFVHEGPQTDLASDEVITVCTGKKTEIQCREGSNLAITNAFWGRTSDKVCPSDDGDPVVDCQGSRDTKALLKVNCENKRKCALEARHAILQKPGSHHCPGVNKYLVARYSCIPESQSLLLCNDVESELNCKAGWKMDVGEVFWGRQDHAQGMCLTDDVVMGGAECPSTRFAENIIRQKCNGTSRCKVKASREDLEDPNKKHRGLSDCDLKDKYLKLTYYCRPSEFFEGTTEKAIVPETVSAPPPAARKAEAKTEPSPSVRKAAKKELLGALKEHIENLAKKKSEMADVSPQEKLNLVEALASVKDAKAGFKQKKDTTPTTPDKKDESTEKKADGVDKIVDDHVAEKVKEEHKEEAKKDEPAKKEETTEKKEEEKKEVETKDTDAIAKKDDAAPKEEKKEETKASEKIEEAAKPEEVKKPEEAIKSEEVKKDEAKPEEKKDESPKKEEAPKTEEKKEETPKTEEKKEEAPKTEEVKEEKKEEAAPIKEEKKEESSKPEEKKTETKETKEEAERTTVKSILARAREVLKNLDGESSFLKRKSLIDHKTKGEQAHVQKKSSIARIPRASRTRIPHPLATPPQAMYNRRNSFKKSRIPKLTSHHNIY